MQNNLIIYPDQISIDNKFNNLFINQFCFDQFDGEKIFSSSIFSSLVNIRENRFKNFDITNSIFYKILPLVRDNLNLIHNVNFSNHSYEILLGAWLRKFIQQLVYKFFILEEVFKKEKIHSVCILDHSKYYFYTSETQTIQHATNDKLWNAHLYSAIIEYLNFDIVKKKITTEQKNFDDTKNQFSQNKNRQKSLKNRLKEIVIKFFNKIPNNSNIFLYDTGLSKIDEVRLCKSFFQIPRFYKDKFQYKYSNLNLNLRNKLHFEKFDDKEDNSILLNFIIRLLPKSLPLFIIEDFEKLNNLSNKLNFPKTPKYILTSYAFENNELFKYYLINQKKKNQKIKYVIFQHGGSYITKIDNKFNNEFITADKFLTWGEKIDNQWNNNIPFYNFKLLNKKYYIKKRYRNSLTVFLRSKGYNALPYDRYLEGKKTMDLTFNFLDQLPYTIKSNTVIRAHSSLKDNLLNYNKILKNFKIDNGNEDYFKVLNSSKIVFFNHDSTGMLETIGSNIPTLCYWANIEEHLNHEVEKDYRHLIDAKILFDNKKNLQNHLEQIWENPEKWWNNKDTQYCVAKFLDLYSKKPSKNFISKLKMIIKN